MEFQFHKGTIRTHDEAEELFRILKNFNSIKVRLEPVSQHVGEENVPDRIAPVEVVDAKTVVRIKHECIARQPSAGSFRHVPLQDQRTGIVIQYHVRRYRRHIAVRGVEYLVLIVLQILIHHVVYVAPGRKDEMGNPVLVCDMEMKGSYKLRRVVPPLRKLVCDMEMKGSYKNFLSFFLIFS